jgi:hypothetical protein
MAAIAAALLCETPGRFIDPELQRVSLSDERLTHSGQSPALFARRGFLSLDLLEPVLKCCPPALGIGPQGLGKRQQRREFCAQVQLISTPERRPSHLYV